MDISNSLRSFNFNFSNFRDLVLENCPPYPYCNKLGLIARGGAQGQVNLSEDSRALSFGQSLNVNLFFRSQVKAFWNVEIGQG